MTPCIVIPTYNERNNIVTLIELIKLICWGTAVIVIDDNSPDGTGKIVEELKKKYNDLAVIHRERKIGIGSAIVEGFKLALSKNFDPIITMDGDLSHSPFYLEKFLRYAPDYDLLIGSRYIRGVRVEGWRFRFLLMSKLANMFVGHVMVKPIWDFTSGFRVYSARFLKLVDMDEIPSQGYLFQIHMIYIAYKLHMRVKELPFVFKDVEYPHSKMSAFERWSTFFKVFRYRAPFWQIIRHLTYIRKNYAKFVQEYEELLRPPPLREVSFMNGNRSKNKPSISIGVMAYNEEQNIRQCLNALLHQQIKSGKIEEIIVVSSGSTDNTNSIVQEYKKKHSLIKLLTQEKRLGKASGINLFLKYARGNICIIVGADINPEQGCIEFLIKPFEDSTVGMTGAHPIPVNEKDSFIEFCVKKLWKLHHLIALETPKCGEMVAFWNILTKIPNYTAVDEAVIESYIREAGFKIVYSSEAIVRNKGPETIKDFLRQRIRIASGHKHLKTIRGYRVATFNSFSVFKYLLKDFKWSLKEILYTFGLIILEAVARAIGFVNFYIRDKNPYVWDIAQTTKVLGSQGTVLRIK